MTRTAPHGARPARPDVDALADHLEAMLESMRDGRRAFIGNLDVNPSLQGHGIATRVLADIRKQIPGYT